MSEQLTALLQEQVSIVQALLRKEQAECERLREILREIYDCDYSHVRVLALARKGLTRAESAAGSGGGW